MLLFIIMFKHMNCTLYYISPSWTECTECGVARVSRLVSMFSKIAKNLKRASALHDDVVVSTCTHEVTVKRSREESGSRQPTRSVLPRNSNKVVHTFDTVCCGVSSLLMAGRMCELLECWSRWTLVIFC